MSWRVIAVCDLCGREQFFGGDLGTETVYELMLQGQGWTIRDDALRLLCPTHLEPAVHDPGCLGNHRGNCEVSGLFDQEQPT